MKRQGSCSNSSQTHRDCGLKGRNSRCQQKERKRPRKNQPRKRSTNALVRFTAPKSFWSQNPNVNPGGEFNFSSRFFCDASPSKSLGGAESFSLCSLFCCAS